MEEIKLSISGGFELELITYGGDWPSLCQFNYIESATDHWSSNSETSVELTKEKAQDIIDLLNEFITKEPTK